MGIKGRGKASAADSDLLEFKIGKIKKQIKDVQLAMEEQDMGGMNTLTTPEPASPFVIFQRTSKKGVFPTMAFTIPNNIDTLKVFLIRDADRTTGAAQKNRYTDEFDDITDAERQAGRLEREFTKPLDFSTKFGLVRLIGIDSRGNRVKNPTADPYTTNPVPELACFITADQDGNGGVDNCGAGTATGAIVLPKPNQNGYVVDNKVNSRGVKPVFSLILPKQATRVRVKLIKKDDFDNNRLNRSIGDDADITPPELTSGSPAMGDERLFQFQFGKLLDFGTVYHTIRIEVDGPNVGGPDIDIYKNPLMVLGVIDNGTFTAGESTQGINTGLKLAATWVDVTLLNGLPKGLVIKNKGVKAFMNFLIPPETRTLKCRIKERNDSTARTLSDEWDDITDAERTSGACSRLFGPLLDFTTTYDFIRLVADGDNIGGEGVDTAKSASSVTGMFNTPNSEGQFTPTGGTLAIGTPTFITKRRTTKQGGIFVTMNIDIPKQAQQVTVKIGRTADNARVTPPPLTQDEIDSATSKVLEYTFMEITDAERAAGNIKREFGIKLDQTTEYGVIRLIAEGSAINSGFQGGGNPDVFRNPKAPPSPRYSYLALFNTESTITFTGATVPGIPREGDVTTTYTGEDIVTTVTIPASELRTDVNAPTFLEVGATAAFAKIRRDTDATDVLPIEVGGTLTDEQLNSKFVTFEIPDIKFGKRYELRKFILTNSQDKAVQTGSDFFRGGGENDLSLLELMNESGGTTGTLTNRLQILSPILKLSGNESLVTVRYREPATGPVLIKNIEMQKIVVGKFTTFRQSGDQIRLLDDQTNFTAGDHDIFFIVGHPPSSTIQLRAIIRSVTGGATPTIIDTTGNLLTDDFPEAGDTGPPAYQSRSANAKCKFRSMGPKVGFTLPDANMRTFAGVQVLIRFEANPAFVDPATSQNVAGQSNKQVFYFNARTISFGTTTGTNIEVEPFPGSALYADIGLSSDVFFDVDRPDESSNGPDFPATIGNALRNAFNASGLSGNINNPLLAFNMQFIVAVFNRFAGSGDPSEIILPGLNNALILRSDKINFPFRAVTATF